MANVSTKKGIIGILTGGGDVPGLNPAIRGVTYRALREGYQVIGIRHGWGGLIDIVRDKDYDNSNNYQMLTEDVVNRASRTGYEVVRVPLHQSGQASGEYEDFLTGFVLDSGEVWGRPVGVTVASDGSLLVSDDASNSIWRVSYAGEPSASPAR